LFNESGRIANDPFRSVVQRRCNDDDLMALVQGVFIERLTEPSWFRSWPFFIYIEIPSASVIPVLELVVVRPFWSAAT
jgi:hypothetical protein